MKSGETKYDAARKKLIKGFLLLLDKKDFLQIGVKELCLVAEVNRSTFYAHYDNTYELLEDCREYLAKSFMETYTEEQRKRFEEGRLEKNYITEEYVLPYLRQIRRNKTIYRTYLKLNLSAKDDVFFERLLERIAYPVAKENGRAYDSNEIRYITRFYVEGINAIVRCWIEGNFEEKEEDICRIITRLVPVIGK